MLKYLTTQDVIIINEFICDSLDTTKSYALIDSAANGLKLTMFGNELYPSIHEKASILCYSLCMNHGFHDGNKRTSLLVTLTFLEYNNFNLKLTNNELFDLITRVADKKLSKNRLTAIFKKHII